MHAISSYQVIDPQTHTNTHTHKNTNPQTGPITIHCAAKLSVQCKEIGLEKHERGCGQG